MSRAQKVNKARLASRVNVIVSVLIWISYGYYAISTDIISDGAQLKLVFIEAFIVCLLVQAIVLVIVVIWIRLEQRNSC